MPSQSLATLIHQQCDANLKRIFRLAVKQHFYEFVTFQVQLSRLDGGIEQYTRNVRKHYPAGSDRARLLSDLSDSRLVIHRYMNQVERLLQATTGRSLSA